MQTKKFAFVAGVIMLIMGALAFIPALSIVPVEGLPALYIESSYGLFLGIFPMNVLNKVAFLVFGAAGMMAGRSVELKDSMAYSQVVFFVMGILALMGLFPQTNTLFGYWPLYGAEVLVHTVFAVLGAYYGFVYPIKGTHQGRTHIQGV